MNIGILTFHNADNYGAVLQCYALQKRLKAMYSNDTVSVIDYKCPQIERCYIPQFKCLKPWSFFSYIKKRRNRRNFRDFRNKYCVMGNDDFSKYDVIFYGSDQIWNTVLTGNDLVYFGSSFGGKKIAYAASDGGEMIFNPSVKELLSSFYKISCREKTLSEKLWKENIQLPIETVCDPVFLLNQAEWLKMARIPKEKDYILAYQVVEAPNFDLEAERLGRILNKQVIRIVYVKPLRKLFYKGQNIVDCIGPEEFVGLFANADFILTTSFHGTVFSLIFEKPFYVLKIPKRSERITDLLNEVGLIDRYVPNVQGSLREENVFLENVKYRIAMLREKSENFLKEL